MYNYEWKLSFDGVLESASHALKNCKLSIQVEYIGRDALRHGGHGGNWKLMLQYQTFAERKEEKSFQLSTKSAYPFIAKLSFSILWSFWRSISIK